MGGITHSADNATVAGQRDRQDLFIFRASPAQRHQMEGVNVRRLQLGIRPDTGGSLVHGAAVTVWFPIQRDLIVDIVQMKPDHRTTGFRKLPVHQKVRHRRRVQHFTEKPVRSAKGVLGFEMQHSEDAFQLRILVRTNKSQGWGPFGILPNEQMIRRLGSEISPPQDILPDSSGCFVVGSNGPVGRGIMGNQPSLDRQGGTHGLRGGIDAR